MALAEQLPGFGFSPSTPVDQSVVRRFCDARRDEIVEAFDAFDRHLVGLDQLEIRKWSGALTDTEQLIGAGIVKHEIKQEFLRSAGRLIANLTDTFGPESVVAIDGVEYRTHNMSLVAEIEREAGKSAVVFGEHEITHQEFQDGFTYPKDYEWSRLLLGMAIEGKRPHAVE